MDYYMDSFMGWIGGKRILRKAILERFPTDKVERYIEVFGGAAWVLFAKEKQAGQLEVYNDINGDLVNLFRCVKYHCGELQREFDWLLSSREQFFDYVAQTNMRGLTDIQRAARFLYRVKISFGKAGEDYATDRKNVSNVIPRLSQAFKRLQGVNIEHKDFADLIRVYDRKGALFYLDPPYIGAEGYYDSPFTPDDHKRLRAALEPLKGRFILSYNDCPQVRELYKGYTIERVERRENLSGSGENKKQYAEVIIRNF